MIGFAEAAVFILLVFGLFKIPFKDIDGSIVMASGIMINGVIQRIAVLKDYIGPCIPILLLIFLARLITGYIFEVQQGLFYDRRLKNPVTGFAIGTLVAGISVTIFSIVSALPTIRILAVILFSFNVLFWALYLVQIVRNYQHLFRHPELLYQVHGVILLACVATQSIVAAGSILFGSSFPRLIAFFLILFGIVCYGLGFILILIRYLRKNRGCLADNWMNTNCIVHGAMSITGLAGTVSHAISLDIITVIWLWALLFFVVIEGFEVFRAIQRIRIYGWKKGIFVYSVSQWSRNFTFGMLLAFTLNFPINDSFLAAPLFQAIRHTLITWGTFAVFALFLLEAVLFVKNGYSVAGMTSRHTNTA